MIKYFTYRHYHKIIKKKELYKNEENFKNINKELKTVV